MGDSIGFTNTSSRKAIRKAIEDSIEDAADPIDSYARQAIHKLTKKMEPIKDMVWFVLEGNHGWDFGRGDTVERRLAGGLEATYCEGLLACAIIFDSKSKPGSKARLNLIAHHGHWGGAPGTVGGDINSLLKRADIFANAHIVAAGHTHRLGCSPGEIRFEMTGVPSIKAITPWYARTGSFVRSYFPGRVSYPERRGMRPSSLGYVEFSAWMERSQHNDGDATEMHLVGRPVLLEAETLTGETQ